MTAQMDTNSTFHCTDPDSSGNVERQDSAESSDFDSAQAEREDHTAAVDDEMSDSTGDENILSWSVPVSNPSRFDATRGSGERSALEHSLETLAVAENVFPQTGPRRFNLFAQGKWQELIIAPRKCDEAADKASVRRRKQQGDTGKSSCFGTDG